MEALYNIIGLQTVFPHSTGSHHLAHPAPPCPLRRHPRRRWRLALPALQVYFTAVKREPSQKRGVNGIVGGLLRH